MLYLYNVFIKVWDSNSDAVITFNNENYSDVSYIVENDLILAALQKEVDCEVVYNTKIDNIMLPKSGETTGTLNSYSFDLLVSLRTSPRLSLATERPPFGDAFVSGVDQFPGDTVFPRVVRSDY